MLYAEIRSIEKDTESRMQLLMDESQHSFEQKLQELQLDLAETIRTKRILMDEIDDLIKIEEDFEMVQEDFTIVSKKYSHLKEKHATLQ